VITSPSILNTSLIWFIQLGKFVALDVTDNN